ncbi:hypothetical protein Goshw_023596, partial [Gossypium schwendimanii]|nr:hypothetical protein [Gossypium schwendimanii]
RARLPTSLEDIRLLLDQQSEAHFQWTLYEDPVIWAVISDEFLQNPNTWHIKVALINCAIVEMHQSNRYAYILIREPIIVSELACVPEYMSWFRIHGKPYLLSPKERQRQFRVQRERRGPLNPRRDYDAGEFPSPFMYPNPYMFPFLSPIAGWS